MVAARGCGPGVFLRTVREWGPGAQRWGEGWKPRVVSEEKATGTQPNCPLLKN